MKEHKDEGGRAMMCILFGPGNKTRAKNPGLGTAGIKMGLFEKDELYLRRNVSAPCS